jgi:hypothetical protein
MTPLERLLGESAGIQPPDPGRPGRGGSRLLRRARVAARLEMQPLAARAHAALGRVLAEAGRCDEAAVREAKAAAHRILGLPPLPTHPFPREG